jgi:wyosine [tRNA(Phe)-imidazoG37] synthetase (radical SAM superfamily)
MKIIGPVPYRNLGQIIGVKNTPEFKCPYSCLYCRAGRRKTRKTISRKYFDRPEDIFSELQNRLVKVKEEDGTVDYFVFLPCGEPTLDLNLQDLIELIRFLGIPVAVHTNGSLLTNDQVKQALNEVDYIFLKIDTVLESTWRKLNRPSELLNLTDIISGIKAFKCNFRGTLVTETRLIDGYNTNKADINKLVDFLNILNPALTCFTVQYLSSEKWEVEMVASEKINQWYQILSKDLKHVEMLRTCERYGTNLQQKIS